MCGGRGTRAYPHTLELPKALLEVADRPVLLHVLELYASQGLIRGHPVAAIVPKRQSCVSASRCSKKSASSGAAAANSFQFMDFRG